MDSVTDTELLAKLIDKCSPGLKHYASMKANMSTPQTFGTLHNSRQCSACKVHNTFSEDRMRDIYDGPTHAMVVSCAFCKRLHVLEVVQNPVGGHMVASWTLISDAIPKPSENESEATWEV